MKRFVIKSSIVFFVIFFFVVGAFAKDASISYKNIKEGSKIYYCAENSAWTTSKKNVGCKVFIKKASEDIENSSEFYAVDGENAFTTGTQYEFVNDGKLIGYSNNDLKFYNYFVSENGLIQQNELLVEEIEALFSNVEIIKISEFSNSTNSLKIKKNRGKMKLLLLNDTDRTFSNYVFTSQNAKLKKGKLLGFIYVLKPGMIQFSRFGENTKDFPWYVLLVR